MRVEEVIKRIGEENWNAFCKWMKGQTMGLYPNGETNIYDCDVEAFEEKLKTGKDRQANPLTWD